MTQTEEEKKAMELMNELVLVLPGFVPIPSDDATVTARMRFGLAKAFAEQGFREYFEMCIRLFNNAYDKTETNVDVAVVKARKLLLKEIYSKSKICFEEMQKLDSKFKV